MANYLKQGAIFILLFTFVDVSHTNVPGHYWAIQIASLVPLMLAVYLWGKWYEEKRT